MDKLLEILNGLHDDVDFTTADKLIDDGIIDSFDVIQLVTEINDAFDVNIGAADLIPENFNSVSAIMALVEKLQNE